MWMANRAQEDRNLLDARGLLVVGTHPKCGKSVASAGLAGVLNELGFTVQAIKPFCFQPEVTVRNGYEQAFFDRLNPPRQPLELLAKPSPWQVTAGDWQYVQELCRKRVYPYILEAPGSVAAPIRFTDLALTDAVDLSEALAIPLVLVTSKSPEVIGTMRPALSYLRDRAARAIGWLAVETQATRVVDWEQDVLFLRGHSNISYLGEIAYSPSVSVEALQQGNLFRLTELGVDLLPIQQALNLRVPH